MVRGREAERVRRVPGRPPEGPRQPGGDHLGRRRPRQQPQRHLPRVARAGVPSGQRAAGARRPPRRPGDDLPAHGGGGCGRHARLRPGGRHPCRGVRRLLPGQPGQPDPGLRLDPGDHRRRGPAGRTPRRAEDQRGRGAAELPDRQGRAGGGRHRRRRADAGRAGPPLRRHARRRVAGLRAGTDGSRGPAVHPLHLRQHGQAEGRAAHHRRLHGLGQLHARAGVRLPAGRNLLVHGRCRLGHRAQLHRLRPARERRHHPDVRGHPELSGRVPLLAGDRQAPGQHLLHRAHRHPRADARWRRPGEGHQPRQPAHPGQRRRADQPGSLAVVLPRRRRRAVPPSSTPGGRRKRAAS